MNAFLRLLLLQGLIFQYYALAAANIRAIFLFKDVMKSNTTALKSSGFNTLIMFGVGVRSNGDIMYYSNTPGSVDVLVASGGAYVGGDALAERVRSLKAVGSGVDRIEISMNSQNIRNLMSSPGAGSSTPLYRNFEALKKSWNLDAVNNDDEVVYDVGSTVAFARMLGAIGYRYTGSPYTNSGFWTSLVKQLNSGLEEENRLLDRMYLQCYDGGAGNNPSGWANALGMKVVPLVWVTNDSKPQYGTTASQASSKFTGWVRGGGLAGGGYWNDFDIEKMKLSYKDYGDVLSRVFP